MNRVALATVTGLVLGVVVVFANFGDMLIVAIFGAIGYGLAKLLDSDTDLPELLSRFRGGDR